MRNSIAKVALLIAGLCLALGCEAQKPEPRPVLDVAYTLSGRTYVLASVGFGERPAFGSKSVAWDYGLATALDVTTQKPAGGLGAWIVWNDGRSPLTARAGAYVLAQDGRPVDFTLGASVGLRF